MYPFACFILFAGVAFVGCTSRQNSTEKDKGEQASSPEEVLGLWVGTWKGKDVAKSAEWNPQETAQDVHLTCQWLLGKKFVEESGEIPATKHKHRYIVGYDAKTNVYRDWLFLSDGSTMQSIGTWNAQTKTMTWKADLGNGITMLATTHFLTADSYEWTAVARDKSGKVYLDMHGKRWREE